VIARNDATTTKSSHNQPPAEMQHDRDRIERARGEEERHHDELADAYEARVIAA
jgi:hypothetical protein